MPSWNKQVRTADIRQWLSDIVKLHGATRALDVAAEEIAKKENLALTLRKGRRPAAKTKVA